MPVFNISAALLLLVELAGETTMQFLKPVIAAIGALALSAAATSSSIAGGQPSSACTTAVTDTADINAHRAAASVFLASYAQTAPTRAPLNAISNPGAEIAQVRKEARRLTSSQHIRVHDEALRAVTAVANYQGSDPATMNRMLRRVDNAADALQHSLSSGGGPSAMQTGAFKCNADRIECKQACSEAKGKACCCGCGVSYVACLVLG
ncbi:hypothetical protein [Sphingomonas xanthus]|uniref:Uncharacterized protein n=1 Tax=Sphingomonas xanthus TaxID=2594473 RepID=A0A516IQY7_9SPHN|nr:hypothetical protein [Sphingomonas xanthus]QDP19301.1 hypothetical protein FMM02_04570 [Sphingomonas xanthus]